MMAPLQGQRGFTLIEVVVAFAIFALCIGALYETFSGATRRGGQARERELALLQAQSVLSQLRARPGPWEARWNGESPSGFAWQVDTARFEAGSDEQNPWQAYEVTVRVRGQSAKAREVSLKSIELARSVP